MMRQPMQELQQKRYILEDYDNYDHYNDDLDDHDDDHDDNNDGNSNYKNFPHIGKYAKWLSAMANLPKGKYKLRYQTHDKLV